MFIAKFDEIWGKDQKKRSSSQKIRECLRILVFISKNARICTKSEVKTKKKGLYPKIYGNFHEFWGETTKTNGIYCKIYEKTVLAREFWGDNQYFGNLRPRTALHSTEPVNFFGAQSSLGGGCKHDLEGHGLGIPPHGAGPVLKFYTLAAMLIIFHGGIVVIKQLRP